MCMEQLVGVRRFMQQPLMKSGHGAWAADGIVAFVSIYVGEVVTVMATRSLVAWVARMRRREILAQPTRQP
jgi:hypothetical protein